jgi:DNA modification methylase
MNNCEIYFDDCFNIFDKIDDKSIKLIITDPPYLHNKGGGKTHGTEGKSKIANSKMYNFDSPMMKDMSSFGEHEINKMLDEFKRICIKLNAFIFCNDTQIPYYLNWCLKNKKKWTILTWEKPLSILNRNRYSQNLEYIVRIYDNGTGLNKIDLDEYPEKKEYYSKNRKMNPPKGKNKFHPVQKPYEYIKGIVELNSDFSDIIFDPFMGSGEVGVVCRDLNRKFIGVEIEKEYFDVAKKRLEQTRAELNNSNNK